MSLGEPLPLVAPGAELEPDGDEPPVCARAKAVLSANVNTNNCRDFFMPVSPRVVDRW